MTFRAKPVVQRAQRPSWETRDRRNFYINLGFGLAVVAAVVILGIAVALSYYNDHLASVGSVAGQAITKDELRERSPSRPGASTRPTGGSARRPRRASLTQAAGRRPDAGHRPAAPAARSRSSLERIIDNRIQAELATEEGVTVTDADIDARLTEEATTPESRHAWLIEVKPTTDSGAEPDRRADRRRARRKIETALADIKGGKAWEDVAKTVSTDSVDRARRPATSAGSTTDDTQDRRGVPRRALRRDGRHADRRHRGRRTGSSASAGSPRSPRRRSTRRTPTRSSTTASTWRSTARSCAATSSARSSRTSSSPTPPSPAPQREVRRDLPQQATVDLPDDAVKVRHILFSPKDDPQPARATATIPEDDPSWGQAKLDAEAAYAKLKDDPQPVRRHRPRRERRGAAPAAPDGTGGVLDAYVSSDSELRRVVHEADPRRQADRRPAAARRSRPSSASTSSRS